MSPITTRESAFGRLRAAAHHSRHLLYFVTGQVRWPEADYLVNHEHKFIYAPIAKVACSSIKRWFLSIAGKHLDEEANEHVAVHPHRLRALSGAAAYRLLRRDDYFNFAFVRNPWARLTSAYLNKFLKVNRVSDRFARKMSLRAEGGGSEAKLLKVTFRQFVRILAKRNPSRFDVHWRPQYLYLQHNRFDFLGRLENLIPDFERLQERVGTSVPLPHCNQTRYIDEPVNENLADRTPQELVQLRTLPPYRQFYTPELRDMVARIYATDIQRFGYSFDDG